MAATATGWSGLLASAQALVLLVDRGALEREITRVGRRMKKVRELALTLNGAAVGEAALYTEGRVTASTTEQGGVRPIETNTYVGRVTDAADKTRIDNAWLKRSVPSTYPTQVGAAPGGNGNIKA